MTDQFSHIATRLGNLESSGVRGGNDGGEAAATDKDDDGDGDDESEELKNIEVRPRKRKTKKARASIFSNPKYSKGLQDLQVRRHPLTISIHSSYKQKCVREHLLTLCNATTMDDIVANNPPITDEEMKNFVDNGDLLTCTVQKFRIDFIRPWKDNKFNALAKSVFVKSFISMYDSGEYSDCDIPNVLLAEWVIAAVLDGHMEYRRKLYRQHFKPLSQEDIDRIKQRKAMNARRGTVRVTLHRVRLRLTNP